MNCCNCTPSRPLVAFSTVADAPILCTLGKGAAEAREAEFGALFTYLLRTERFDMGFRWVLRREAGVEQATRTLAAREHECCQFLSFAITADDSAITWEVSGPEHAREVIQMFCDLPSTVQKGPGALRQDAERAGLAFADDAIVHK